jgi:hypothetical protein
MNAFYKRLQSKFYSKTLITQRAFKRIDIFLNDCLVLNFYILHVYYSGKVKGYKLQYKLHITTHKSQVASCKLQITSHKLKLQVTNNKLQFTSYKLQVTSYKLQITIYKLQATIQNSQVTSFKLQVLVYNCYGISNTEM